MSNPFGVSGTGGVPSNYNWGMLCNELSMRVGQAECGELLSVDELAACMESARREINTMRPLKYFSSFPVQSGVQRYAADAVLPNNYLEGAQFYWLGGSSGSCSTIGLFGQYGDIYTFIFNNLVNTGGQYIDQMRFETVFKQYSIIRRYFNARGWLGDDGYVWLDPVPSATDVCYYSADVPRFPTVLSINEKWAEPFFDYAEYKACTLLALKQSEVMRATYGPGKAIETSGGRIYADRAKEARTRFYEAVGAGPRIRRISSGL